MGTAPPLRGLRQGHRIFADALGVVRGGAVVAVEHGRGDGVVAPARLRIKTKNINKL